MGVLNRISLNVVRNASDVTVLSICEVYSAALLFFHHSSSLPCITFVHALIFATTHMTCDTSLEQDCRLGPLQPPSCVTIAAVDFIVTDQVASGGPATSIWSSALPVDILPVWALDSLALPRSTPAGWITTLLSSMY